MRRSWMMTSALSALLLSATACAGASSAPPSTETEVAGQSVQWVDCFEGLSCGSVSVPADWREPDASERVTIGLGRFPARDPATRIGTLLMNPGGPNPVLFALPRLASLAADLTQWFDVVVFDPRGMGESSGVSCPTPAPAPLLAVPPDRAAFMAYAAGNERFARDCAAALGPLRDTLDAWQVAHDMDALRTVLGEDELTYVGNSYGTVYGQAYLELFGGNVGRMYLDSVADHTTSDLYAQVAPKAEVLEANLHEFARWCAGETRCALHGQDPLEVWDRVLAAAARHPIAAPESGTSVDAAALVGSATLSIRRQRAWPDLAAGLAAAGRGDAGAFVPSPPPRNPDVPGGELMGLATCSDLTGPIDHDQLVRLEADLRAIAPRVGWSEPWTFVARCAGLPAATYPPHAIVSSEAPSVLVVNGNSDSATPPEYGRRLVGQLPGARYLAADGGHAVYLSGDPCVRGHVNHYLATGELPPPDATCAAVS
ncbi:alpha/beta hydrolase [Pseudonocardia xinjiangensis]|uniref:alpha/beta hydrolase n=1 Tax=Pseudonocardia xinjiangensis TaxID=75289 RepID=UPI003D8EED6C